MTTVFLTGATGFIGAAIARELSRSGYSIRALVRPGSNRSNLAGIDLEICEGDILWPDSLKKGIKGCEAVYHVAADYRLWSRNPSEMYRINVEGTRNVLTAALYQGVERVVYTSSVGTLGNPGDGIPGDETTPVTVEDMVGDYKKSKFEAERVAENFVPRGLPLVIVNPSTPIGSHDIRPTPTGRIIVDFLNGRMPAFLHTGLNLIDVEDCARGHILAATRGNIGEKYILGNENLTLRQIFLLLEELTGVRAPTLRLPYLPVLVAAHLNEALSRITGREPLIPVAGVRMAGKLMYFQSTKAVHNLGLPQHPVAAALAKAVEWFRAAGYAR